MSNQLLKEKHIQYIKSLDHVIFSWEYYGSTNLQNREELDYWLTEHLRLNGVYWGLTALCLLGEPNILDRDEMIKYVQSCQTDEGHITRFSLLTRRWIWRAYRS